MEASEVSLWIGIESIYAFSKCISFTYVHCICNKSKTFSLKDVGLTVPKIRKIHAVIFVARQKMMTFKMCNPIIQ